MMRLLLTVMKWLGFGFIWFNAMNIAFLIGIAAYNITHDTLTLILVHDLLMAAILALTGILLAGICVLITRHSLKHTANLTVRKTRSKIVG